VKPNKAQSQKAAKRRVTMKWSLWRMIVALTIAVVLVLATRYLGWSHTPITVE
jgi:anti-sigma-K factor RskA